MVKTIITCSRLCAALYYPDGFPIEGMPDKCLCSDIVDKKTPAALPITLKWYKPPEPEPERKDDRPETPGDDD